MSVNSDMRYCRCSASHRIVMLPRREADAASGVEFLRLVRGKDVAPDVPPPGAVAEPAPPPPPPTAEAAADAPDGTAGEHGKPLTMFLA